MDNNLTIYESIEEIINRNLKEKTIDYTLTLDNCEKCKYYNKAYIYGGNLYCCSHNIDNPITSRNMDELFDNCPLYHKLPMKKYYLKRYGIIHQKPDETYNSKGCVSIVDFKATRFEWDGRNPEVYYEDIVIFFYNNDKEKEIILKLALDYYNRFNFNDEYVEKHYAP